MELQTFLEHMNKRQYVQAGSEVHRYMTRLSDEARRITTQINCSYRTPEEIRKLFFRLIEKPEDDTFGLFPPFYTDCGKNITVGKRIHQCGMSVTGSGRDHHWRRKSDRPQCGDRHFKS